LVVIVAKVVVVPNDNDTAEVGGVPKIMYVEYKKLGIRKHSYS